jgi:hypothetical protein
MENRHTDMTALLVRIVERAVVRIPQRFAVPGGGETRQFPDFGRAVICPLLYLSARWSNC